MCRIPSARYSLAGAATAAAPGFHRPQMIGTHTPLLSPKGARTLLAFPRRSLRSLRKPFALESCRSLKSLRTPPIVAGMEEDAPRNPAPPASVDGTAAAGGISTSVSTAAGGGIGGGDCFGLSPSTVLKLQKGDITTWFVDGSTDAIANAADERMLGGGGVDGAIHRAAGPELLEACSKVPEVRPGVRCPTGEARITPAFQLPVSHVIHTVGPIYDVDKQPEVSLGNAYRNSLRLAKESNIQYIAFPAISCGVYGYPYKEASRIAISTAKEFSDDLKEMKAMHRRGVPTNGAKAGWLYVQILEKPKCSAINRR